MSLSDKIYYSRGVPLCQQNLRKNLRNFQTLKIIIKTGENRHFSALFSSAFSSMKNCCPSGNSVGRQKFFCGDVSQAPHALCPNPPIPPYGAGAEIWAVGFLFCGEQPLNILEVVGLRAPTAVAECRRHSAKSRPSLRMERALRFGQCDSFSAASNH